MAIQIQSYNQILGNMIRKIIAETPLNDINTGSVLLSLMEACATNDFENNVAILSVLELLNIDVLKNVDLDARAADFGLVRKVANRASGFIKISDTTITKRSTSLFPIKPAPIAGSTKLYVNNASGWNTTGQLFIGGGTANFEGPISYTNIINNVTFYTIELASALENDHLISESVVDAQGTTDRLISAGTAIKIPANAQSPDIKYTTVRDAVIPAGDDYVDNVEIIASAAGTASNAGINTITDFISNTFAGAKVENIVPLTNGTDVETDFELRERIKSFANTLARGTSSAILSGIIGISDNFDNKQVASAVITEPVSSGDPSIIYVDDGSGFQPSFTGQSVDIMLDNATGNEEYLQLTNYPLPRPQVINTVNGPYQLNDGMTIRVRVDDNEEAVYFNASDFVNISAATLPEIVTIINNQSTIFKARLTNVSSRLLLYPATHNAEIIQVSTQRSDEEDALFANNIFKFPTNEFSYIKLYKNSTLLRERENAASLLSTAFSTWGITIAGNIIISVDNTPAQDQSFTLTDFGGAAWNSLTLQDWVDVFNTKFAGVQAEALSSGLMRISSNRTGNSSAIAILGGTYMDKWFADTATEATGQTSDFELNRQNGNIRILTTIEAGDDITAGVEDAKGALISASTITGNYNISSDGNGIVATMVIVADADRVTPRSIVAPIGSTLTISDQGNSVMRILSSSLSTFLNVFATTNDYIFLVNRVSDITWLSADNTGLFKVTARGDHTSVGVDSYIEVLNQNMIPEGPIAVKAAEDIQAFYSDKYPQVWIGGTMVDNPPAAPIQSIVDSINNNIENVIASIFKTDSIKITSSTEDGGSIAIPIVIGNATLLYPTGNSAEVGNASHIANRATKVETISYFRRTEPTKNNIWLNRYAYNDVKGPLTKNEMPGVENIDSFAEVLEAKGTLTDSNIKHDDIVSFTKGDNEGHYKAIKQILSGDRVGTRFSNPKTVLNHIKYNDEIEVLESSQLSSEDTIVMILDNDSINKTIDVAMSRTGRVNSGSQAVTFIPNNTAFSADDSDNEVGIDFGTPQVWSKTLNKTEFADYKTWFKARNWYCSGGVAGAVGKFLVRAKQYGPVGHNIRFALDYPTISDVTNTVVHLNYPAYSYYTYYFGSGPVRTIGAAAGDIINVTDLGSGFFRLQFVGTGIDFSTVIPGDVLSILNNSGVTVSNQGQFRINATNGVDTIDIYNPNGSPTTGAANEITSITAIADIAGTSRVDTLDTTADNGGTLDGKYFILYDSNGSVAFWVAIDDGTTLEPAHAATRSIRMGNIASTDTNADVRNRLITAINADPEFSAAAGTGNKLVVTHAGVGVSTIADAGTTAITITSVAGTNPVSLNGKYFKLQDQNGSVAVWFDVDNTGTQEPLHGADRSIRVGTINSGDASAVVAAAVRAEIHADAEFNCSAVVGSTFLATDAQVGNRPTPGAGTSGFTVSTNTNGSSGIPEVIVIPSSVNMFPLLNTAVSDIVTAVNAGDILELVAVGSDTLTIEYATREEIVAAVSYGHDPDPISGNNRHVNLYDGETWVLNFNNSNPNFTLKKPFVLPGIAPTVYSMDTAPNTTGDPGEYFKLIPTTLQNIQHHLTQKALSQLSIVSSVDITTSAKKIQIKSKQLGSSGAIEVVGGRANSAEFNIVGDAEVINFNGKDYLAVKTISYPDTVNPDDTVLFNNLTGVNRLSRIQSTDTMDTIKLGDNCYYMYNDKLVYLTPYVEMAISDVSSSHNRPAGTVWRWTHNEAGSLANITDKTIGVPGNQANDWNAAGSGDAAALERIIINAGTISTYQNFTLTVDATPVQADYYTFESADGTTFAVWFDLGGAAPTGASYVAATNKITVPINIADNYNTLVTKLVNALNGNANFVASFDAYQTSSASFTEVNAGDLLMVYGTFAGWNVGNKASGTGESQVAGFPVIAVNAASRYIDVVNPFGSSMTASQIGIGNTIKVVPSPMIEWKVPHAARASILQSVVSSGTAICTTNDAHRLNVGDKFYILNNNAIPNAPGSVTLPSGEILDVGTVTTITAYNVFQYATAAADGSYIGGAIMKFALHDSMDIQNTLSGVTTDTADGVSPTGFAFVKYQEGSLSSKEITKITMVPDVAGSLNSTYFTLHSADDETDYYVWYDASGGGIDPTLLGYTGIKVSIVIGDSAEKVAYKTTMALSSIVDFKVKTGYDVTRYKLEKLNFKGLTRISRVYGESPRFLDCGVAIDDLLIISGNTFNSNNNGVFRVRAIDNDSIIYENESSRKEVNTDTTPFNNSGTAVDWQQNAAQITGIAGSFENLNVGDSVKKQEDPEGFWVQILSFNTLNPKTATVLTLNAAYQGTTSTSTGIKFNQVDDVESGVKLQSINDIRILEGDCVRVSDTLFISNMVNSNWFNLNNTGNFTIQSVGTYSDYRPYLQVINAAAVAENNRLVSVDLGGIIIKEYDYNNFSSYRKVEHIIQDNFNSSRRIAYLTPADRAYKFSESNRTKMQSSGKLLFNTDVTSGIDGYSYYTGLLRTVQRVIDGFEPDPETYPGRRAVGGAIEILPPLISRISVSIDITTDEGVNLGEISNEIKTVIINYINNLGVGKDVVLSEIIAKIMNIRGVGAATFNIPTPSTERIYIDSIEKAFIEAKDISLA